MPPLLRGDPSEACLFATNLGHIRHCRMATVGTFARVCPQSLYKPYGIFHRAIYYYDYPVGTTRPIPIARF